MKLTAKKIKDLIKVDIENYKQLEQIYYDDKQASLARIYVHRRRALESLLKYINYLESV